MTENRPQRLFVALWPDAAVRSALVDVQAQLGLVRFGRPTPAENLHVTLLFLGEVPHSAVADVEHFVESVEFSPFSLSFSRIGHWRHNGIVWAAPDDVGGELNDLFSRIRTGLGRGGSDQRRFVPHVTLARKVGRPVGGRMRPVRWAVREVDLVRSTPTNEGARYERLTQSKVSD